MGHFLILKNCICMFKLTLLLLLSVLPSICFAGKEKDYVLPDASPEKQKEYIDDLFGKAKSRIANRDYASARSLLTERLRLLNLYYEENGTAGVQENATGYEYLSVLPLLYSNYRLGCCEENIKEIVFISFQYCMLFKKDHPQEDLLETEIAESYFRSGNVGMAIETAERLIDRLYRDNDRSSVVYHKMYYRLMAYYESTGRTGTKFYRDAYRPKAMAAGLSDIPKTLDADMPFGDKMVGLMETAASYSLDGEHDVARLVLKECLSLLEAEYPCDRRVDDPDIDNRHGLLKVQLLSMMAKTYDWIITPDEEARYFLQMNVTWNGKLHGENSTEFAEASWKFGSYYHYVEDDCEAALAYYQVASRILKTSNGFNKGRLIDVLGAMMLCHAKKGDAKRAAEDAKELIDATRDLVASAFMVSSSAERAALWDKYNHWLLETIPRMALRFEGEIDFGAELYDIALFSKGLLMMSDNAMADLALKKGGDGIIKEGRQLKQLRLQLHSQLTSLDLDDIVNVDKTRSRIESVEHNLVQEVNRLGRWQSGLDVSWRDVKKQLKEGECAIEFLECGRPYLENGAIIALVLSADSPSPVMRRICSRSDLSYSSSFKHCKTTEFYDAYWRRIEPCLGQARSIFFSPVGVLNIIPIEYCLVDSTESLFDKYEMYRLTSTRKLLERNDKKKRIETAYLYGGLDYRPDLLDIYKANVDLIKEGYVDNGTNGIDKDVVVDESKYSSVKFKEDPELMYIYKSTLASTLLLAEQLGRVGCKTHLFTDFRGTEECFKGMSKKPIDILYVGTHGFTFTDSDYSNHYTFTYKKDWVDVTRDEMAMTLSGLLLSGASMAYSPTIGRNGLEDGVITAAEVAQLNLEGVQLVHLSACETGLGKVTPEGVIGLQRGFKRAGVQAIITTLASVVSITSLYFDSVFYHALFSDGNGKKWKTPSIHAAFTSSVKKQRSAYKDVEYWCPYVLIDALD